MASSDKIVDLLDRRREDLLGRSKGRPGDLKSDGGGGTFDGMERIARLEAQMESVDKRLDRIDGKLDRIIERTGALPTTNGLWGMIATVIGVGLAIAGLTFVVAEWVKP